MPDTSPRRSELALCVAAIIFLFPLFWALGRIVIDVALDLPMEQQPWPSPHGR